MQDLHAQSLEEASREKEDLQNLIAEEERELKAAQDKLEEKEKELQEHKVEAERVGKRLEKVDRQVDIKPLSPEWPAAAPVLAVSETCAWVSEVEARR